MLYSGALGDAAVPVMRADLVAAGAPRDRVVIEPRSRNTRENAVETARVIAAHGWKSLLLVTSAGHVQRAVGCFRELGLVPDVLAVTDSAPLPRGSRAIVALRRSSDLLHEMIGRVVYRAGHR